MKCAIAIFAKTIGLSPVKTRLAVSIGQDKAEQFYRLSIACIEDVLRAVVSENPSIFPHWVLAEEEGPTHFAFGSFPTVWTGEGELGDRLAKVSHKFFETHDAVFLIGTDSPQMSLNNILAAVQKLEKNSEINHIAGPAKDGGFWLWGSRKPLSLEAWQSVPYSVETTLEELIKVTNEHGHNVSIGDELQDVDVLEDLTTMQITLEQKENKLLPAQGVLLKWLQENSSIFQG